MNYQAPAPMVCIDQELTCSNSNNAPTTLADWSAFVDLMEPTPLTNGADMPPLRPQQEQASAPFPCLPVSQSQVQVQRSVSPEQSNFVLSDRLAEILPELEVTYEAPNEDDHKGLFQFFADSDAWLKPTETLSMPLPALVRRVSASASNSSGNSSDSDNSNGYSTASSSSRSTTTSTTMSRKKRTKKASNGSKRKLGRPAAFPQKLHTMLTSVPLQDAHLSHIVGFTPDGSAFEIHDTEAFVDAILPKYFKMSSFSSFQRQLQLYNFKRVSKGGAYRQAMFHRDMPQDLHKIVRKQSKPSSFLMSLAAAKSA